MRVSLVDGAIGKALNSDVIWDRIGCATDDAGVEAPLGLSSWDSWGALEGKNRSKETAGRLGRLLSVLGMVYADEAEDASRADDLDEGGK